MSNLFESVLNQKIVNHLNQSNLLNEKKHRYRLARGTANCNIVESVNVSVEGSLSLT